MKKDKRFWKKDKKNHEKTEHSGKLKILTGKIKAIRGHTAYFISDSSNLEVEIPTRQINTAMSGDKVEIKLFKKNKAGFHEGEVTKVLSRAKNYFVGVIEMSEKGAIIIPDDRRVKISIKIPKEKIGSLKNEDKVRVKITKWVATPGYSEGEIVNVLGKKGDNSTEMNSIAVDKGFDTDFPEKVTRESNNIFEHNKTISGEEISKRKDLRNTFTCTIDPKTAKDFDDAISFKKLPNENFEIGVHIADVSHYVTEKSELDHEAYARGCSVYLPDRTIPMLPFELSDNLCSLSEGDEKLAFSAIFEITQHAKVLSKWFGKSVIKSAKRFTYESAQEILDKKSGEHFEALDTLNKIAKLFRKDKTQKGAIDFESDEIAFELDPAGKPIRIYKKQRLDTHKLVEEFMLLANKEVAEFVYKYEKNSKKLFPLPYRIHDLPDKDRIAELAVFVKALGHELFVGPTGNVTGKDLQALFEQIEGKAEEGLIKTAALRSMSKAIYSTRNIGHFGLAFEYYAHFTSPIRRYPDLLVHRILNKILIKDSVAEKNLAFYEKACLHSTDQEIKAAEAERDGRKYKQIEFMLDKVGKIFDGTITGVTEWGVYAEDFETKAEGMIKLSSLGDDFYKLDKKTYSIIGEKTKKVYSLGQKVKIKLVSADLDRRQMDYEIVE
ncbi:MAG: ribonuclease R [Candidatus Paceibacterota bacterium]|jgi:ribonuclease R